MANDIDLLYQHLEATDKAGDTVKAQKIASKIRELKAAKAASPQEDQIAVGLEPATFMATSGAAVPVSGLAGLAGTLVPDSLGGDEGMGARWQAATESALTDDIDTQQGRNELEIIANMPVIKQMGEFAQDYTDEVKRNVRTIGDGGAITVPNPFGETAEDDFTIVSKENIPLLQTAIETAATAGPEAAMALLGIKGGGLARQGVKEVANIVDEFKGPVFDAAKETTDSIVKQVSGTPEYNIYDDKGLFTPESVEIIGDIYNKRLSEKPRVAQQAKRLQEEGKPEAEIEAFLKRALDLDDVLSPNEMTRHNTFKETNVTPLRADITGSTDDWRIQRDAMKQSNDISKRVAQQDIELKSTAESLREGTGGQSNINDRKGTSKRLFGLMDSVVQKYDDATTRAYQMARERSKDGRNIKLDELVTTTRKNLALSPAEGSSGVPKTIINILRRDGILPAEGYKVQGRVDVDTAERIRQEINTLYPDTKGLGRGMIRDIKESLDNDVMKVAGEDVFKEARQAKIDYHKLIEREKGKRDKTKSSFVEEIINEKVSPEDIIDKLKGANVRFPDLVHLRKFLVESSGTEGKQLWHDMRAQIMEDGITAATKNMGKQEGGVQVFDGIAFKNHVYGAIGGVDNAQRRNLFFNPDEQSLVNNIAEIKKLRTAPGAVQSGSGASGFAIEELLREVQAQETFAGVPYRKMGRGAKWLHGALMNRTNRKNVKAPTRQTDAAIKKQIDENQQN